jgi:hypothetical protein
LRDRDRMRRARHPGNESECGAVTHHVQPLATGNRT